MVPTMDEDASTKLEELVVQALFGPQDYAVLSYKPSAETPVRSQR